MRTLTAFLILSFFMSLAHVAEAAPSVASFGVTQGSKEWKEQELEEWFKWRISKDLAQFIEPELFNVFVEVTMLNSSNSVRRVSNVNLSMFGTVASLVKQTRANPRKGLFGQVHRLDVTLVAAESLNATTVEGMLKVIRKNIPMIKQDKIHTSVVKIDPPGLGLLGWIRELKGLIGVLLVLGLVLWVAKSVLKQVKFQGTIRLGAQPVSAQGVSIVPDAMKTKIPGAPTHKPVSEGPIAGLVPLELLGQGYEVTEEVETEDMPEDLLEKSMLEDTEVAIELRKIRSLLLGMSIDECVNVCKADPYLGAVVSTLLTPDKATKVTARLLPDDRKKMIAATMEWDSAKVAQNAKSIVENIKRFKFGKVESGKLGERMSVYLDQVGPDGEEKVFEELLSGGRHTDFAWLVRDALPTALLEHVPDELIASVLTHISYEDQVEILAFSPQNISDRVWKLVPMSSLQVKSLVESDVQKKRNEVQYGDPVSHGSLGILMRVVRKALRTNREWFAHVEPHVEDWIFSRTQGAEGKKHGQAA